MNEKLLRKLLAGGEGYTVEFKKCQNELSNSVYETVCAFSNRYGGHILLGVDDNGKILGVNPKAVPGIKKNFTNMLNNPQKIAPALYLELESFEVRGKTILYVYVPVGSLVEICSGKLYDRNQDADIDITTNTILAAELYDRKRGIFTERKLFPHLTKDRLKIKELMPKVKMRVEIRNAKHPWLSMSDMDIMRSANLCDIDPQTGKECFNLAAVLLFGKGETIFSCCPGYLTDCILRKVNLDRYDDRLMVTTNLIDSFDEILGFIQKHTQDPFYLEGASAVSIRDKIAREIVSNSLTHREYSSTKPARIIIEKERIYADNWNRSNLFGQLDPESFSPDPKNPIIARFFVNIAYADTLGSGMRNLTKYTPLYANGKMPQMIEGDVFQTIVPLPAENATEDKREKQAAKASGKSKRQKQAAKASGKSDKTSERVNIVLSSLRQKKVITTNEVAGLLGLSPARSRAILSLLVREGLLCAEGEDKTRRYRLL